MTLLCSERLSWPAEHTLAELPPAMRTEVLRDDATEATEPAQQLPQQSHRSFLASLPLEFGEDALPLSADEAQPKRGNFEDLDLRQTRKIPKPLLELRPLSETIVVVLLLVLLLLLLFWCWW
jgi:hypothetical protein